MNSFSLFFLICAAIAFAVAAFTSLNRRRRFDLANGIANGEWGEGRINQFADAAIGRYRLVKEGAATNSIQVAGAADRPLGITDDEAANTTDAIAIRLLGCTRGTARMVSDGSAAIARGDLLVPAANGAVKTIAAGAGNYFVVGRALEAVGNGNQDVFMVVPLGYGLTK